MDPGSYAAAFDSGEVVELGTFHFADRLVVCDPFHCRAAPALAANVPAGDARVRLRLADARGFGVRVGLARIDFQDTVETDHGPAVDHTGSDAFVVGSGLCCFLDERARQAFATRLERFYSDNPGGNYYTDVLAPELAVNGTPSRPEGDWVIHRPGPGEPSVPIFASGMGDGAFRSFWGYAADGTPASLTTDFRLL